MEAMMMRGRGHKMSKKDEEAAVNAEDKSVGHRKNGAGVALTSEAQGAITKQLQQMYGDMLSAPMPDKFAQLLDKLARSEK